MSSASLLYTGLSAMSCKQKLMMANLVEAPRSLRIQPLVPVYVEITKWINDLQLRRQAHSRSAAHSLRSEGRLTLLINPGPLLLTQCHDGLGITTISFTAPHSQPKTPGTFASTVASLSLHWWRGVRRPTVT